MNTKIRRYWSAIGLRQRIECILATGFAVVFVGMLLRLAYVAPEIFFPIFGIALFMYSMLQFFKVLDDFNDYR